MQWIATLIISIFLSSIASAGTVYNRNQWYKGYGPNPKGVPGYTTHSIPLFFVQPSLGVMQTRAYEDPTAIEDHTEYPTPSPNEYVQTDRSLEDYFDAVMNGAGPQAPSGYQTYDTRSPTNLSVGGSPSNKNLFPITADFMNPDLAPGASPDLLYGTYSIKMTAGMVYRAEFDCGTDFEHPSYDARGMEQYNGENLVTETNADYCFFLYIPPVTYPDGTVEGPMVGPVDPADDDTKAYIASGLAPLLPIKGDLENRIVSDPDINYLDGRYTVRSPYSRILIPQNGLNLFANRYNAGRLYMADRGRRIKTKSKGSLAIVVGAIVGVVLAAVTMGASLTVTAALIGGAAGAGVGYLMTPGPETSAPAGVGGGSKTATPSWANLGKLGPIWMFMEPTDSSPKKYAWGAAFPTLDMENQMLDAADGWPPNSDFAAGGVVTPPNPDIMALMPGMVTDERRFQFDQKSSYVPMTTTDTAMDGLGAVEKDCSSADMAPICNKYKPLLDAVDNYCSGSCGPCEEGNEAALQAKMEMTDSSVSAGSRSFVAGQCYADLAAIYDNHSGLVDDWNDALSNPTSKDVDLLRTPMGEKWAVQYNTIETAVSVAGATLADRWFISTDENDTFVSNLKPGVEACKDDFDALPPLPAPPPLSTRETDYHVCVKSAAGPVMADYAAIEANPAIQTPFAFYTAKHPLGKQLLGKLAWVEDYSGQPSPPVYNTYFDTADRCTPETPITTEFIPCIMPKVGLGVMASPKNLDKRWED